ncbi:MAG: hypothetical protein V4534_04375 [Myxococcota bacterium]
MEGVQACLIARINLSKVLAEIATTSGSVLRPEWSHLALEQQTQLAHVPKVLAVTASIGQSLPEQAHAYNMAARLTNAFFVGSALDLLHDEQFDPLPANSLFSDNTYEEVCRTLSEVGSAIWADSPMLSFNRVVAAVKNARNKV